MFSSCTWQLALDSCFTKLIYEPLLPITAPTDAFGMYKKQVMWPPMLLACGGESGGIMWGIADARAAPGPPVWTKLYNKKRQYNIKHVNSKFMYSMFEQGCVSI